MARKHFNRLPATQGNPKIQMSVYWMVTGEWQELMVTKGTTVATPENPNPDPEDRVALVRRVLTEATDEHPLQYTVHMQEKRPGYACIFAMPIGRAVYDWLNKLVALMAEQERRKVESLEGSESSEISPEQGEDQQSGVIVPA